MKTEIVISINVHEKPEYFKYQLENIKKFIKLDNKILVSCNDYMYNELSNQKDLEIIVNPDIINKKRHHGSLTNGIYSNMKYSIENIDFKYFLIMSSREFFYREINSLDDIIKTKVNNNHNDYINTKHIPWFNENFKNSELFKYITDKNLFFSTSPHEGLCFDLKSCEYIITFLDEKSEIKNNIFNFEHGVEEFALQTICCNISDYFNIGNGTSTISIENVSPHRYTHKRVR